MPATVKIGRWTGAPTGTFNDVTSITTRLGQNDSITGGTLPRPSSGTNRSFWANLRFSVQTAPTTFLNNVWAYNNLV